VDWILDKVDENSILDFTLDIQNADLALGNANSMQDWALGFRLMALHLRSTFLSQIPIKEMQMHHKCWCEIIVILSSTCDST
ncbi:hypothetical protein HAX54_009577, partial [Datura stramonium]|nr:hypothetical protein [Datura stramonium]